MRRSITNLMVGDWVNVDGKAGKIAFVSNTDFVNVEIDDTLSIETENPEPIPLTADLLEKNGFNVVHNKRSVTCDVRTEYYHIKIEFTDKIAIEIHNAITGKDGKGRHDLVSFGRDWFDVLNVHQLQHALKLCNIQKEIQL